MCSVHANQTNYQFIIYHLHQVMIPGLYLIYPCHDKIKEAASEDNWRRRTGSILAILGREMGSHRRSKRRVWELQLLFLFLVEMPPRVCFPLFLRQQLSCFLCPGSVWVLKFEVLLENWLNKNSLFYLLSRRNGRPSSKAFSHRVKILRNRNLNSIQIYVIKLILLNETTFSGSPVTNLVDAQHSLVQGLGTVASHLPGLARGWGAWRTSGLNPLRPGVSFSHMFTNTSCLNWVY